MVLDTFLILSWTTQCFVTQKLGLFKMSSILHNIHPDCSSSNACLHYLCCDVPTDNAGLHPPCALLHSISKACGHQETWDMGLCTAAQETNMNTLRLRYSCLEHSTCTSHIYISHGTPWKPNFNNAMAHFSDGDSKMDNPSWLAVVMWVKASRCFKI